MDKLMSQVAAAINDNFTSPNETDRNLEAANVVDGLYAIARAIHHLARATEGYIPTYSAEQLRHYDNPRNRYWQSIGEEEEPS